MSIITLRILTQFSTSFETFSALPNFFCWATIDGALTECLLKKFEIFCDVNIAFSDGKMEQLTHNVNPFCHTWSSVLKTSSFQSCLYLSYKDSSDDA